MLDKIRVILVNTSHPGNIGAAARAMKTMGLSQLVLVNPKKFPAKDALVLASNAEDILENAKVVSSLEEALAECQLAFGTSTRNRKIAWPLLSPTEAVEKMFQGISTQTVSDIALVFGSERFGLTNEELAQCQYQIHIPTCLPTMSLNLAQAVQVIAYEIYKKYLSCSPQESAPKASEAREQDEKLLPHAVLPTHQELSDFYKALEKSLIDLNFLSLEQPGHLMARLKRLYGRAEIDKTELNILRGILTAIQKKLVPSERKRVEGSREAEGSQREKVEFTKSDD